MRLHRSTIPRQIPTVFGERVYLVLDRIAPAPYVESSLAQLALERGDAAAAAHYALRLPALVESRRASFPRRERTRFAPTRVRVRAGGLRRRRRRRGSTTARRARSPYRLRTGGALGAAFERAHDTSRRARADALAHGSLRQQDGLEKSTRERVAASLAAQSARRFRGGRAAGAALGALRYRRRNQADLLGERASAARLFRQAAAIDPTSADAVAGLGVIAFENGDASPRASIWRALARSIRIR